MSLGTHSTPDMTPPVSNTDSIIVIQWLDNGLNTGQQAAFWLFISVIDSFLDVIYSVRYCCHRSCHSWRSPSSVLLDSGQHRIRTQGRLDQPAVQHHVVNDWEDVCSLPNLKASWTFVVLAEMVPLCQYCFELCSRQLDCHIHIRSMQPSSSTVGGNDKASQC